MDVWGWLFSIGLDVLLLLDCVYRLRGFGRVYVGGSVNKSVKKIETGMGHKTTDAFISKVSRSGW